MSHVSQDRPRYAFLRPRICLVGDFPLRRLAEGVHERFAVFRLLRWLAACLFVGDSVALCSGGAECLGSLLVFVVVRLGRLWKDAFRQVLVVLRGSVRGPLHDFRCGIHAVSRIAHHIGEIRVAYG